MKLSDITIPDHTLQTWQTLLNLLAIKFQIPVALIMKIDLPDIKVFLSSESDGNPYEVGDSEHLVGSGLYCEWVIKHQSKLVVPDALKSIHWNKNPDIKLGMISYMGFPICWPNGEVFGTTCVLDSKENSYNEEYSNALSLFAEYIESCLDYAVSRYLGEDEMRIKEKDMRCHKLLLEIEQYFARSIR